MADNTLPLHAEAARFAGAELLHPTLKPGACDALVAAFGIDDTEPRTDPL